MYELKDMTNEPIIGTFYRQELQSVQTNDNETYEIERIIQKRKRSGKEQALVKWAGFDKKFNSWIDVDTINDYK